MKNLQLGCKIIALFILVTVIIHWPLISMFTNLFQLNQIDNWAIFMAASSILYFVLNLGAAGGLFCTKKWGFILTYIAMTYSTLLFAVSYIPFLAKIIKLLSHSSLLSQTSLIVINLMIMAYVIYLHISLNHKMSVTSKQSK